MAHPTLRVIEGWLAAGADEKEEWGAASSAGEGTAFGTTRPAAPREYYQDEDHGTEMLGRLFLSGFIMLAVLLLVAVNGC